MGMHVVRRLLPKTPRDAAVIGERIAARTHAGQKQIRITAGTADAAFADRRPSIAGSLPDNASLGKAPARPKDSLSSNSDA